ncbi:hypothetical protein HaLaN_25708 [Haematococcus lacustris]|uniref:Uncharacterized protein n=1 Tax=Haematococcus lacustris TaxID=44745 RepID=A0A699ZZ15_HAELA|nr:hypothetical protein HaLaN_25708 [Haematococcus lacustris]
MKGKVTAGQVKKRVGSERTQRLVAARQYLVQAGRDW